jgi:thiamine biosynthesis lipoprotein
MHTRIDMLLYDKTESKLRNTVAVISDTLHDLEMTANFYDPTGELSKVNQTAHIKPIKLSKDLFRIISLCRMYREKTAGCFDIAIHSDNYHAGTFRSIVSDEENQTIYFTEQGLRLDLSGFLKGYALDKAREICRNLSQENALINIGNSSVMAIGNHPHGEGWKVGLATTEKEFLLKNECLTTSGNDSLGRKHIICPHTGKYIEGKGTVSVITPTGSEGEALSTALFVANPEQKERLTRFAGQPPRSVYYFTTL